MTRRRIAAAVLAVLTVTALVAGCSSDDESSSSKKKTTTTTATTTTVPTPSTVTDADFEKAVATSEAIIKDAGGDACKVANAFTQFTAAVPTPANATQARRAVEVVASLFEAAAATAPPANQADAAALRKAAADLRTEGEAKGWDPAWLSSTPGPAALSDPAFVKAFQNYQSAIQAACAPASGSTTTTP